MDDYWEDADYEDDDYWEDEDYDYEDDDYYCSDSDTKGLFKEYLYRQRSGFFRNYGGPME